MTTAEMKKLAEELAADKDFAEKLAAASDEEKATLLADKGIKTEEDVMMFADVIAKNMEDAELSEEQLDSVAGGEWGVYDRNFVGALQMIGYGLFNIGLAKIGLINPKNVKQGQWRN